MQVHSDFALSNWTDNDMTTRHFNRFNPTNGVDFAHMLTFEPTTKWNYENAEFQMWGITEWEMVDDSTFEFSINTDITWENGDALTSQDLATQYRLAKVNNNAIWNFTDSIETPDDSTVRLNLPDGANPQLLKIFLNNTYFHTKHSEFEQYLEGVGEDANTELASELQSMEITDPVANGPFTVSDTNQQRMNLGRREDYHMSENVNFGTYEMRFISGNQQVWQELLGSSIDTVWSLFTPPRIVADFPNTVIESAIPAYWGYGLCPQHEHEHVGNKNVRQAIMHVINRPAVVRNAGPRSKESPEVPSCIASSQVDNWLGDEKDDYETYGWSQETSEDNVNTEEATQLLNDAGYEKQDGTWMKDGSTVDIPVTVPAGWSDWVSATRTIVDQLNQFGFNASVDAQGGSFWSKAADGDFTLIAWWWLTGGVRGSHPYFNGRHQFNMSEAGVTYNYSDPEGAFDAIGDVATMTSQEEATSVIRDVATIANDELPVLPVTEKLDQTFVNNQRLDAPEAGSAAYQTRWPSAWLVKNGQLTANPQ